MKFDETPGGATRVRAEGGPDRSPQAGVAVDDTHAATRTRVVRSLVEDGPATAAALAERLGLTPGAVRRHLDALMDEQWVRAGERPPFGPTAPRGRGRPARVYSVTGLGRQAGGPSDDHLAVEVLRFLRDASGPDAVRDFARTRLSGQRERYEAHLTSLSAAERPEALADLLTREGYAATAESVPGNSEGVQLCQHHCPMATVASEFGEFCEAESEMFAELLGTPVRRLATLAHGDGVCTTHLTMSIDPSLPDPSGDRSTS